MSADDQQPGDDEIKKEDSLVIDAPIAPTLEMASESDGEASPTVHADLFDDNGLALITGKFAMADFLLKLVTRDCKFSDFMREVLLVVLRVVKSEAGSILEVDHKNKTIFFRAVVGQSSDRLTEFTVPMGQGIVGYVAESKQPLLVDNVSENKIHLKAIQAAVGFETRNMIAVPILVRGQTFAVLELLNRVGEETYTPSDLELINYFCEAASRAIEARLMIAYQRKHGDSDPASGSRDAA